MAEKKVDCLDDQTVETWVVSMADSRAELTVANLAEQMAA
jgi:hypothetical protein